MRKLLSAFVGITGFVFYSKVLLAGVAPGFAGFESLNGQGNNTGNSNNVSYAASSNSGGNGFWGAESSGSVTTIAPDIKANGQDGPITISTADTLSVTVSLNAGGNTNTADWWALAQISSGRWFYYNLSSRSFQTGSNVTYTGPLFDLGNYQVLNLSGLPQDTYTFYFSVDLTPDGSQTTGSGQWHSDSVVVNVGNTATPTPTPSPTPTPGPTPAPTATPTPTSPSNALPGTYSYSATNPSMSGNCSMIKTLLGCSSAASCLIVGTSGQMTMSVSGSNLTAKLKGQGSPAWVTFTGSANNNFTATHSASQTAAGCTVATSGTLTGNNQGSGSIPGKINVRVKVSGSCFGLNLDCNISADYTANKISSSLSTTAYDKSPMENNPEGYRDSALSTILSVK